MSWHGIVTEREGMYQSIATEIDGAVGILTLNRPARHNALDETLITEITTGLLALEAAASVRVVVLSSAGGTFCAGADMNWLRRETTNSLQENLRDARHLGRLMATLNNLSKPTIGRIQGPSFGSGVGLVACCDIAVATYDAQFALSDVKLGIIPAVVSPFIMAAIGERFVRRYTLSAERFSAAEAYRIGLVHEIVPDETQLDQALFEIVENLLKNGPQAMAECKSMLRAFSRHPINDAVIEEAAQRMARVRSSPEGKEGLSAFIKKRKPNWIV